MLREILMPKTGDLRGGYANLHNEELNNVHFSGNVISLLNRHK
jgi:hypothetical protein